MNFWFSCSLSLLISGAKKNHVLQVQKETKSPLDLLSSIIIIVHN
jgi:hypothetical protein